MQIITAPDICVIPKDHLCCFLAGGITGCHDWQKEVLEHIKELDDIVTLDRLTLFNPRRPFFNVLDKNASKEQIRWEFDAINRSNIFSMYFAASESVQPISLYELGRVAGRYAEHFISIPPEYLIITIENGYKRAFDVIEQIELLTGRSDLVEVVDYPDLAVKKHAWKIVDAYRYIVEDKG